MRKCHIIGFVMMRLYFYCMICTTLNTVLVAFVRIPVHYPDDIHVYTVNERANRPLIVIDFFLKKLSTSAKQLAYPD